VDSSEGALMPPDYGLVRRTASFQTSAPLHLRLTPDAVLRPRNGFEPFQFYVAAAFGALAESPLPPSPVAVFLDRIQFPLTYNP